MNRLRESVTYQAILEEGRERTVDLGRLGGERHLLPRLGTATLGPPPPSIRAAIQAINDSSRLDELGVASLEPTTTSESLRAGVGDD